MTTEPIVINDDCIQAITAMPAHSVDAVITDPPYELGFMGKGWDSSGIAYSVTLWRECLRVLKPGGHLLAFGGTRTYHRLACAVEDAGFEIRDSITWLYGSGFPKSMDVSKAIDKAARATPDAERWAGWGTALKPASEPIVVARKPLAGTVAQTVLAHGTGALNIDACRVASDETLVRPSVLRTDNDVLGKGLGAGVQIEPSGRWPANVILSHAATAEGGDACAEGCVPGCPVTDLDAQSGVSGSGGASRFFSVFRYQAKAPTRERPKVDGVAHPTVKPIDLMRWLVRLVTPPGGVVLEPFAGSGTTVEACILESFGCIAIEREETYLPLIQARIDRADPPLIVSENTQPEVSTMTTEPDPFGAPAGHVLMGRSGVPRDRWGRAILPHPLTGVEQPWTSVTTLAGILEDKTGLHNWSKNNVAKGVAMRPDLLALAASADHNTKDGKAVLRKVVKAAEEAAGATAGANIGTALHGMCQRLDAGQALDSLTVPEPWTRDVPAYLAALAENSLTVRSDLVEQLVVTPETDTAGSFDNIYAEADGTLVIGDKKTSAELKYGHMTMAVQLAIYAHGTHLWDREAKTYREMPKVRQDYALVVWLPAGQGHCEVLPIDIEAGWQAALYAAQLHGTWRKKKDWMLSAYVPPTPPADPWVSLFEQINAVTSRAEMIELWAIWQDSWTPAHTDAGNARLKVLEENPATG